HRARRRVTGVRTLAGKPSSLCNRQRGVILTCGTRTTALSPDNPLDLRELTGDCEKANSRFFTDCYLEAVAIAPPRRRKLGQRDNASRIPVAHRLHQISKLRRFSFNMKYFHGGCSLRRDVERPRRRKPGPLSSARRHRQLACRRRKAGMSS